MLASELCPNFTAQEVALIATKKAKNYEETKAVFFKNYQNQRAELVKLPNAKKLVRSVSLEDIRASFGFTNAMRLYNASSLFKSKFNTEVETQANESSMQITTESKKI